MKLSDYARQQGVTYRTAWNWFRNGLVSGKQIGRMIIVDEERPVRKDSSVVVVYARLSSTENKSNLDTQAERLQRYCEAKGYQVARARQGDGLRD